MSATISVRTLLSARLSAMAKVGCGAWSPEFPSKERRKGERRRPQCHSSLTTLRDHHRCSTPIHTQACRLRLDIYRQLTTVCLHACHRPICLMDYPLEGHMAFRYLWSMRRASQLTNHPINLLLHPNNHQRRSIHRKQTQFPVALMATTLTPRRSPPYKHLITSIRHPDQRQVLCPLLTR